MVLLPTPAGPSIAIINLRAWDSVMVKQLIVNGRLEKGAQFCPGQNGRGRSLILSRRGSYPAWYSLPNATDLRRIFRHRGTGLARKSLGEFRHVHHHSIHPILRRRMRIGDGSHPQILRALIATCPLREAHEEPLV